MTTYRLNRLITIATGFISFLAIFILMTSALAASTVAGPVASVVCLLIAALFASLLLCYPEMAKAYLP